MSRHKRIFLFPKIDYVSSKLTLEKYLQAIEMTDLVHQFFNKSDLNISDLVNFFKIVISMAHQQLYSNIYNKFCDVVNIRTPKQLLSSYFEKNLQLLTRFFENGVSHLLCSFVSMETLFQAEKFEIEKCKDEQILKITYRNGRKCQFWEMRYFFSTNGNRIHAKRSDGNAAQIVNCSIEGISKLPFTEKKFIPLQFIQLFYCPKKR